MSDALDETRRAADRLYTLLIEEARSSFSSTTRTLTLPTVRTIVTTHPPEVQGELILIACEQMIAGMTHGSLDWRVAFAREIVVALLKHRIRIPSDRLPVIVDFCTVIGVYAHRIPVLSLLQPVSGPPTTRLAESLRRLRDAVSGSTFGGASMRKIVARIDEILEGDGGTRALDPGGPWSERVLRDLAAIDPLKRDVWRDLALHLLDVGQGEPSQKWIKALDTHLDAVDRDRFVERALEWLALGPVPADNVDPPLVSDRDADYLKGFVWGLSACVDAAVVRAIADLAEQCFAKIPNHGAVSLRVGHACVRVLARASGLESIAQLGRLRTRVKYAVGLKLIEKALEEAAAQAGLGAEELEEMSVPTFDLDGDGTRRQALGDHVALVAIRGSAGARDDVVLAWMTKEDRSQKSVPQAVRDEHAAALASLKKAVKDIANVLPAQKARLEGCSNLIARSRSISGGSATRIIHCSARWRDV